MLADATAASEHGDHVRALDLAPRAAQMQMTPTLRVFIAGEPQAVGHLAEPVGSATACVREVGALPSLNHRNEILSECRRIVASLTPRLGGVLVQLPNPVPDGTVVHIGALMLPPVLYGTAFRVTPGNVTVDVSAPQRRAFHSVVAVATGAVATVAVTLEAAPANANTASSASSAPDRGPVGESQCDIAECGVAGCTVSRRSALVSTGARGANDSAANTTLSGHADRAGRGLGHRRCSRRGGCRADRHRIHRRSQPVAALPECGGPVRVRFKPVGSVQQR